MRRILFVNKLSVPHRLQHLCDHHDTSAKAYPNHELAQAHKTQNHNDHAPLQSIVVHEKQAPYATMYQPAAKMRHAHKAQNGKCDHNQAHGLHDDHNDQLQHQPATLAINQDAHLADAASPQAF